MSNPDMSEDRAASRPELRVLRDHSHPAPDQTAQVVNATTALVRAVEASRRRFAAEAGIAVNELRTLVLAVEISGLTPKQVSTYLGISAGAVTPISDSLVRTGLLLRAEHPHDRRSIVLSPTDTGLALVESLATRYRHSFSQGLIVFRDRHGDHLFGELASLLADVTESLARDQP